MANNYAFIDGQNLNLSIQALGWHLDFHRFRVYLNEKYNVVKAYYFIGYLPANTELYNSLQSKGYILVFKPVATKVDGKWKGNCDAELVLQAMIDFVNYDKAVIVSSDGDFSCLVNYLKRQNKLEVVLSPSYSNCSTLLKKAAGTQVDFMDNLRNKLEYKRKSTP